MNTKTLSIINVIAIVLTLVMVGLVLQKEYFETQKTYYVDNSNIRASFQGQMQKDILSAKISNETEITNKVMNFDKDLDITVNDLAKEFNINIYATRALYSKGENIDLTPKVVEILTSKGYNVQ